MIPQRTLLVISLLLIVCETFAHTLLESSAPAANARADAPVEEIVLEFADAVRLTAVTLSDASAASKALGAVPTDTAARFVIEVREPLAAGEYVITWRAVGADTHVVSGEIPFRVLGKAHAR